MGLGAPSVIGPIRNAKVPVWALARDYTNEAIFKLVTLMRHAQSEAIQKAAADSLLDRAWGKSPMIVLDQGEREQRINIAVLGAEQSEALESALMSLLGDAIEHAPGRNASLVGGDLVQPALDIAASDAPSANDSCVDAQHNNTSGTNDAQAIDNTSDSVASVSGDGVASESQ